MDIENLNEIAFETLRASWAKFGRIYKLVKPCPTIMLNNRLKSTAGRCDFEKRVIDLSTLLFHENQGEFERVIIPHEVAHQVAFDVYKDAGHGEARKSVMIMYGLPPERCHNLKSQVVETAKAAAGKAKIRKMAEAFVLGDVAIFDHTDRQKNVTPITGPVIRLNLTTITMVDRKTGKEWRVPYENSCNLGHA